MSVTPISQLENIHLRFINIKDDKKLTEILSKILPNLLNVYLESDLVNQDLTDPKILALKQVMDHLMMRVKNSQLVLPPILLLLEVFTSKQYLDFENRLIRSHLTNLIFDFFYASFKRIPEDQDVIILNAFLQILDHEEVPYSLKCKVFMIFLECLKPFVKDLAMIKLSGILKQILTNGKRTAFLQMCLYFIMHSTSRNAIQPSLIEGFTNSAEEMVQKFKDDFKMSATVFSQFYDDLVLKVMGMQDVISVEESLPILLLASQSNLYKTKETAEMSLRGTFSAIDTKDGKMSKTIYQLLFNENYIYRDFEAREDHQCQEGMPVKVQIKLAEYLMRMECSATQSPLNQRFIFHCFYSSQAPQLIKLGFKFITHIIRYDDLQKEGTIRFLKQTLMKIQEDEQLAQFSKGMCYQLLADMALKNYAVLEGEKDMVIKAFDHLRRIIATIEREGQQAVRSDEAALTYIEALNKFRDCYEKNLKDTNKRGMILNYVVNYLHKEGKANDEIVYLLFLYLCRLDQGAYKSSVLLYSILFKDHADIKIKKEAQLQLEKIEQASSKERNQLLLLRFMENIQEFLKRNGLVFDGQLMIQEYLMFNGSQQQYTLDFINKLFDISHFVIKFLKEELPYHDKNDIKDAKQQIEFLLLMNLNQNFKTLKSDFSQALALINQYLKLTAPSKFLVEVGSELILDLASGSANLPQRVLALKIQLKMFSASEPWQIEERVGLLSQGLPSIENLPTVQEQKLNLIYKLTILTIFHPNSQTKEAVWALFEHLILTTISAQGLSPNQMELVRMLAVALKKVSFYLPFIQREPFNEETVNKVCTFLFEVIRRRELDGNFRKFLIANYGGVLRLASESKKKDTIRLVIEDMKEYENTDIQEKVGKFLAKVTYSCGEEEFKGFIESQIGLTFAPVTLSIKRNAAIYLSQLVTYYGKTQEIVKDKFLDFQKVFLKFLFDRKPYMQDISSKGLSLIYELGSESVRAQLVDSLSLTLSGEKSATEHHEKDENQEIFLEFQDNTSSEQKEKLKTYKDLCNIAVELGHRELIYQFLEVHRHLAHYQDIKNAAKGLSSIIMLDQKLKQDLLNISPKILLLTYDPNQEVSETMRELWSTLIEIQDEEKIIESNWPQIFKEAVQGLQSQEYRKRQSSALALSDLLNKRSWEQMKGQFRLVFLTSLGLLDDQKDTVKMAAFQLAKTMKRIALKLGNIYTNSNASELEEVLTIVIPMILDDCMKSNIQLVRFFAVDLLFEIVKTSQQQNMMSKLKFQNKNEKQLVFNYNSEQRMREILNKFLDRIILEVIDNISKMNQAVETINKFEQMAISHGYAKKAGSKMGISETEFNEMKLKYTKEQTWGEILKICRDQMSERTFDKILGDLINFMRTAHDAVTKMVAAQFVCDIILENKTHLITPQNSRRLAQKLVEVYSLSSPQQASATKESLVNAYAQCLGLQMKILKAYPKTVAQIVESLTILPRELELVVLINIYEIFKNLPEDMSKQDAGALYKQALPIFYINRFQLNNHKLKTLSRRIHQHMSDMIPQLIESNQSVIFTRIKDFLESNSYDDRVAAALAMNELAGKLSEEDVQGSQIVLQVVDKIHQLIQGKYFNNKEMVVEGFISVLKILDRSLLNRTEFVNSYLETCLKQIQKSSESNPAYKNWVIKSATLCLQRSEMIFDQNKQAMGELLLGECGESLKKVSQSASWMENIDSFEEKKEEEKQRLQTALDALDCLIYLITISEEMEKRLAEMGMTFYPNSNWIVRNAFLKTTIAILRDQAHPTKGHIVSLGAGIIWNVAQSGEKYDGNLTLISDLLLVLCDSHHQQVVSQGQGQQLKEAGATILSMLGEKNSEEMIKNVDVIRNKLAQIQL